jgi:transposase
LSLRQGLQEALHRLGRVPRELRVDNSSAATHRVGAGRTAREFNEAFDSLCEHYGLEPRTIGINCPNENGDVESSNGHLKRRLRQHLLLRGSWDFESVYGYFLERALERGNQGRREKLAQELAVMKLLPPTRLPEVTDSTASRTNCWANQSKNRTRIVPASNRS